MFVIVQCMTNLKSDPDYSKWSLDTKLGMALRHAGVSITVTSATDVVAFAVGAVTVNNQKKIFERISELISIVRTHGFNKMILEKNFLIHQAVSL